MVMDGSPPDDGEFRIGPYRVVRHVAQGGMGAVYQVEEPGTGQHYALKLAANRRQDEDRFDRIHRTLSAIDHPGIMRSHRCGTTPDGRRFMLFDFVSGTPAQVFAKSMGTPGTVDRTAAVVTVGIHLGEALDHLHGRGIIHRDVKSANVLVRADRSACLIDFDSAVMPGLPIEQGRFVGTYSYAPPEQLQGHPIDARSDVYAMGVLLFRMLSGVRPFDGETHHDVIHHHLHTPAPALDRMVRGLPPRVVELVKAMLQKRPSDRPQSAAEVVDRLRKAH